MNDKQVTEQSKLAKTQFWNRVQLLLVLAVFAAPIAGAFFYQPANFSNYGDLYRPARSVPNLSLNATRKIDKSSPDHIELDSFRRQWVLLVTANGECVQACEDNILKMRQLRFMQNQNMKRIRTVFLHTNLATDVALDLAEKYSPIEAYSVASSDYLEWHKVLLLENAPAEAQLNRLYIIDPAGNLMISYPATADPSMIKVDVKRLLKTSQIG